MDLLEQYQQKVEDGMSYRTTLKDLLKLRVIDYNQYRKLILQVHKERTIEE